MCVFFRDPNRRHTVWLLFMDIPCLFVGREGENFWIPYEVTPTVPIHPFLHGDGREILAAAGPRKLDIGKAEVRGWDRTVVANGEKPHVRFL